MEIGSAMATGFFKAACGKNEPLCSNLVAPDVADMHRVLALICIGMLISNSALLYFEVGYASLQLGLLGFNSMQLLLSSHYTIT